MVTSVYRSPTRQLELYNQWRTLRARGLSDEQVAQYYGIYTPAPPGKSLHNYGLAWDMQGPRGDLEQAGRIWNSWGGHWNAADPVHFEYRGA